MCHISKPNPMEYNPFYQGYIDKVDGLPVFDLLTSQAHQLSRVFVDLSTGDMDVSPSPGKWSDNQIFGHLLDTEKIMHFRALMIARQPGVELPGFDQDVFVAAGNFTGKAALAGSIEGILANRQLIRLFLDTIRPKQLLHIGKVDGHDMSVRALVYIICGHMQHHLEQFYNRRGWDL